MCIKAGVTYIHFGCNKWSVYELLLVYLKILYRRGSIHLTVRLGQVRLSILHEPGYFSESTLGF